MKDNINEGEKMTEKMFMRSIYVSLLSIGLCIAVLCSVTWAWFSDSVSSATNTIKTGNCTVEINVSDQFGNRIDPVDGTDEKYTLSSGSYLITVTSSGSVNTSYCKLNIANNDYYTQQISTSEPDNAISFTLIFEEDTVLEIYRRWGSYHIPEEERDFFDEGEYSDLTQGKGGI